MHRICLVLVLAIITAGCANLNSIHREFDTAKGKSQLIDIRQRAILVAPVPGDTATYGTDETKVHICAEPSPDAMASLALQLAMEGSYKGTGAKAAMAMQESAAFVGLRTQSIQLLRDYGYRLCESYMDGAIDESQYEILMRRFQKNTVALLAIEALTGTVKSPNVILTSSGTAEVAASLADLRAQSEVLGTQIDEITKDIATKTAEEKAATDDKVKADLKTQITALTATKTRLEGDRKAYNDAIANARGVLATGKTEVTVETGGAAPRADSHIAAVATTVKDITTEILRGDDTQQICLGIIRGNDAKADTREFCLRYLKNNETAFEEKIKAAKQITSSVPSLGFFDKSKTPNFSVPAAPREQGAKIEDIERLLQR